MSQPVCLVSGAGDGTGAAIARRFASGDYRAPSHSCGLHYDRRRHRHTLDTPASVSE